MLPTTIHWDDETRRASFEQWLAGVSPRHGLQPQRRLKLARRDADDLVEDTIEMAPAGVGDVGEQ